MKTPFPILVTLLLLIPALPASSEPLTPQEIASELGSKPSYTKAEVVELLYRAGVIFDEELERVKAETTAIWEAKIRELKEAMALDVATYKKQAADAIAERDTWRLVGVGLCAAAVAGICYTALHK